jgi:DNA-binding HxlR family transcriptional regulator
MSATLPQRLPYASILTCCLQVITMALCTSLNMKQKTTSGKKGDARRSPCPVACTLDILGDRWTLLIIRDLYLGRTRFRDFIASPEGIPTNILTDRLERLLEQKIIEQIPASDGTKRFAYSLTKKGKALGPILQAIRDWGLAWEKDTKAMLAVPGP